MKSILYLLNHKSFIVDMTFKKVIIKVKKLLFMLDCDRMTMLNYFIFSVYNLFSLFKLTFARHIYLLIEQHISLLLHTGDWYDANNVVDIETQALATGGSPNISSAFTINGLPGDLFSCSQNRMLPPCIYYSMHM